MPRGFYCLIGAQFASGLADNTLLLLGIAFLLEQGHPAWWAPLLKFAFTLSYVLLAPWLGPLADSVPKPRLMAWMNGLKVVAVALLLGGQHPLLAFALAGLAASVYAPAKYGWVTEQVPASQLVHANGWLEVSVVLAVLLGVAGGGALLAWPVNTPAFLDGLPVPTRLGPAFVVVVLIYGAAAVLNLGIGHTPATRAARHWHAGALLRRFVRDNRRLWNDPMGRISLGATTLFWGAGAVVQFAVLAWAQASLGLSLQHGAWLQATVALGVIAGAVVAARHVVLAQAARVLPWGVALGALLPAVAFITSLWLALPLLVAVGVAGGLLMVPMNALLQHRGHALLSAGRSIAVQGFNENLSVLVMLGAYSALLALDIPLQVLMLLLGGLLAAAMWWLQRWAQPVAVRRRSVAAP